MSEQDNVRIVREMYAAFGRRDFKAVLDRLADDIEWKIAGPSEITYAGVHRGRDAVAKFFQTLDQVAEFDSFEAKEYFSQGDKVVVLGHERQRVKKTGQVVETEWAMVFTLRGGKIAKYHNFIDTHALAAAHRGG